VLFCRSKWRKEKTGSRATRMRFFLILIDLYYFSFLKTTARGQMYQEPTPFFINSQNIPFSSLNDFSFSLWVCARSRSWTGKSGCTSYRELATIFLSCIMWENLLPLQKNIVWVWLGSAPFVRAITIRTNVSKKVVWYNLTWCGMIFSRITPSGSFTVKHIWVSPVHLNKTRWQPRQ